MKASTKRILSILIAIIMIIGSIFVYSSLIRPAYSEIKKLRSEVVSRLELVNKYKDSIERVRKLLNEYQNVVQFQDTISMILPLEQNLPLAAYQIYKIAKMNDLELESLSTQQLAFKPSVQPNLVKGIGVLRLNLQIVGSYEKFKSFLRYLETNITLMDLSSLKIEQQIKNPNGINYTLVVDTYYQGAD